MLSTTKEFNIRMNRAKANGSKVASAVLKYIKSLKVEGSTLEGKWRTRKVRRRDSSSFVKIVHSNGDESIARLPSDFYFVLSSAWRKQELGECPRFDAWEMNEFDAYFSSDSVLHIKRGKGAKFIESVIRPLVPESAVSIYCDFYSHVFPTESVVAACAEDGTVHAVGFIVDNVEVLDSWACKCVEASWMEAYSNSEAGFYKLLRYAYSLGIQMFTNTNTQRTSVINSTNGTGPRRGVNDELIHSGYPYIEVPLRYYPKYKGGYPGKSALRNLIFDPETHILYATNAASYSMSSRLVGERGVDNTMRLRMQICPSCGRLISTRNGSEALCLDCKRFVSHDTCFGSVLTGKGKKVDGIGTVPDYFFNAEGPMKDTAKAMLMLRCITRTS